MNELTRRIINVSLFSIAMAFLEAAVVVYMRKLYYPSGFDFPLRLMEFSIAQVEFIREAATLVMILTVAFITGKSKIQKFAAFIFVFALWDIFYYVFLYLTLGWPSSLMTWDILFLIPVTWTGPVIAPLINSLTMILLAWGIVYAENRDVERVIHNKDWWLLIVGSVVVIIAYIEDFLRFLLNDYTLKELLMVLYSDEVIQKSLSYIPADFSWYVFIAGLCMHIFAVGNIFLRALKQ